MHSEAPVTSDIFKITLPCPPASPAGRGDGDLLDGIFFDDSFMENSSCMISKSGFSLVVCSGF